jgi:uncharacterized protein (DUF3084 family)
MPVIYGTVCTLELAAELSWLIEDAVDRARRVDGWRPSEAAWRFVEEVKSLAQTYREAEAARRVAPTVAHAMGKTSRAGNVVYMTTKEVAKAQDVTVAAVAARCRRQTVPGAKQTAHGWRIPISYLQAP